MISIAKIEQMFVFYKHTLVYYEYINVILQKC